jgi:hypothetical protein
MLGALVEKIEMALVMIVRPTGFVRKSAKLQRPET